VGLTRQPRARIYTLLGGGAMAGRRAWSAKGRTRKGPGKYYENKHVGSDKGIHYVTNTWRPWLVNNTMTMPCDRDWHGACETWTTSGTGTVFRIHFSNGHTLHGQAQWRR